MSENEIIEKARQAVLQYDMEMAEEAAEEAIEAGLNPVEVINDGFTKGMTEVGDLFESKKLFLPHVVAAANAMTAGVDILTPELERTGASMGEGKGTVVICSIEGDIHSIGKDIVALMLKIAGYDIINLGRDIPCVDIVAAAKKQKTMGVATSALMTSTIVNQITVEELMKEAGLKDSVITMVGGAPVTQKWADQIGADLYSENASECVVKINAMEPKA